MKTYRIVLGSFGVVFVDADSVQETANTITFFRGNTATAVYARSTVEAYAEASTELNSDLYGHRLVDAVT